MLIPGAGREHASQGSRPHGAFILAYADGRLIINKEINPFQIVMISEANEVPKGRVTVEGEVGIHLG